MTLEMQLTAATLRLARLEAACAEMQKNLAVLNGQRKRFDQAALRAARPIDPALMEAFRAAARIFGVEPEMLRSRRRTPWLVALRHQTAYLIRQNTTKTYREIGEVLGGDHSVIIFACRSVQNRIDTEPKFAAEMDQFRQRFLEAIGHQT